MFSPVILLITMHFLNSYEKEKNLLLPLHLRMAILPSSLLPYSSLKHRVHTIVRHRPLRLPALKFSPDLEAPAHTRWDGHTELTDSLIPYNERRKRKRSLHIKGILSSAKIRFKTLQSLLIALFWCLRPAVVSFGFFFKLQINFKFTRKRMPLGVKFIHLKNMLIFKKQSLP